uniref:phospho-N-acetylmuramoyl-pentapeptide- transferase n=1 Tax=uncultured Abyssibacter sp. TaxID=2320202 RepID=UPI0032B2496B
MLYHLTDALERIYSGFNLFDYLTVRAILGVLTALVVSLLCGPILIRRLTTRQIGQVVRDDGPQSHLVKAGTPTMGGLLILAAVIIATLLWSDLTNRFVWIAVFVTVAFGVVGFIDDYRKIRYGNSKGLSAKAKYFWLSLTGFLATGVLYATAQTPVETTLYFPFFKQLAIPLGGFFVLWGYFVIVGTSNAVNLTDGLDGLAIMPCVLVASALGVFAYATGNTVYSEYLGIP